jgi:xylulokinase
MSDTFLLGFDVGSSSVKASLVDAATGKEVSSATSPETEMKMEAKKPGWAEQDPEMWWTHVKAAASKIGSDHSAEMKKTAAVGISYQMHGLVVLDDQGIVLRPSIIWCDSRAVEYGNRAFRELGEEFCLSHFLNSPGNFTAAKLAWVKENEPDLYGKVDKFCLPGDYIAYRMTGEINTTPSGLSEGILWDSKKGGIADALLDFYGFSPDMVPEITPNFSVQGVLTSEAAGELGLTAGTPVSYRAGDQSNNALSLNVLEPGELATTAGTSGVMYGIVDTPAYDPASRVNPFVHVNHSEEHPRYGVLMCLNGTGILNRWLRETVCGPEGSTVSYERMNELAAECPPGAEGLMVFPYGNGAERTLKNLDLGASLGNINFNLHTPAHIYRAGQEGIIFALNYGIGIMREMGMDIRTVKAGYANMFLSPLFREVFATVTGATVELYSTDGAQGAARGAGVGAGVFDDFETAFQGLDLKAVVEPDKGSMDRYASLYDSWVRELENRI